MDTGHYDWSQYASDGQDEGHHRYDASDEDGELVEGESSARGALRAKQVAPGNGRPHL